MNEATGGEGATVQQKEIITIADIRLLVDTFYGRARQDELIGPVFNNTIKDRWPQHLDRLYGFWETVLLGRRSYHGVPFMPHVPLQIHGDHFSRWLELFHGTLDDLFQGAKADEAKQRSVMMARMFQYKIAAHAQPAPPIRQSIQDHTADPYPHHEQPHDEDHS